MVLYSAAYRKRISDAARIRGKRSALTTRARCLAQEIDADTMRQRALYDRRGTAIIVGVVHTEVGQVACRVEWSVSGRSDQADVWIDGRLTTTVRIGKVIEQILSTK